MNSMWSSYVQTSEELYKSRELRFRTDNSDLWIKPTDIKDHTKVLEIGCAGGLLCHKLKEALPGVSITGLDRDTSHIKYAKEKSKEIGHEGEFLIGDALALPFEDNCFDTTISHTVIEHVETKTFLKEQYRVLKEGGNICVLSVRTGLSKYQGDDNPYSKEIEDLFDKLYKGHDEFDKKNEIGKYRLNECDFPISLEEAGFKNIKVDFMALTNYLPDNFDTLESDVLNQINVHRIHSLSGVSKGISLYPDSLNKEEIDRLKKLVNNKYDKRIKDYNNKIKHWDMSVSIVMAIRGVK